MGRKKPVKHTVHTRHPRYNVPQYPRGSDKGKTRKTASLHPLSNNKIKHFSEWDGTRRTYRAEYILKRYNPKTAKEIAKILYEGMNQECKTIYDVQYPMFLKDKNLVKYVTESRPESPDWHNYYITHVDMVDINADLWKLSPTLRKRYPSKKKMFMGTDIGAGWHNQMKDVSKEISRLRKKDERKGIKKKILI